MSVRPLAETSASLRSSVSGRPARRAIAAPAVSVVLFLIAVTFPFSLSVGGIVLTGTRIVLLAMTLPIIAGLLSGRYGRLLPTDWLFALHSLWSLCALAANNPDRVLQFGGVYNLDFIGAYLLGRACIRNAEQMAGMIRVMVILVSLTLPLAIFEAVTGRNLVLEFYRALPVVYPNAQSYGELRMGLHRVQMGFQTPIHYGIYATLCFALCLVGLRGLVSDGSRRLLSGVTLACGFLSLSSGAVLAIAMQGFMIAWQGIVRSSRRWLWLLGLMAVAYLAVDILSNRSPFRVFMTYATFSPQTAYWRDLIGTYGMQNVWSHPFFGIGLNDWERPAWMYISSVDNFWLLTAMRFGIPGFLALAIGYVLAVVGAIRAHVDGDPVTLRIRRAWVFTALGIAFSLYTVHVWNDIHSVIFFMIGAGMWLTDARFETNPAESANTPEAPDRSVRFSRNLGAAAERPAMTWQRSPSAEPAETARPQAAPVRRPAPVEEDTRADRAPVYSRFSPKDRPDRKS